MQKEKNRTLIRIFRNLVCLLFVFICAGLFLYIKLLPKFISGDSFINFLQSAVKKTTNADLIIKDLSVQTGFSPVIKIHSGLIKLTKNNEKIFTSVGLDTDISFKNIIKRQIILEKAGAVNIYTDINKILALFPQDENKNKQKNDWEVKWFESLLYLKHFHIKYLPANDTNIDIVGKNITISDTTNPKFVRFDIDADVTKNNKTIHLALSDNDTVYIKDKILNIDNGIVKVNNSKISINAKVDEKNNYNIDLFSNNFDVKNIESLMDSNLILANGSEIMQYFKDLKGNFDFNINLKKDGLNGHINVNKSYFQLTPLNNMPINVNNGNITITPEEIKFNNFKGFYGNRQRNTLTMDGNILDYQKSVASDIKIKSNVTNDFTKYYLSPLVGTPLTLTGDSNAIILIKTLYNKIDVQGMFKLEKGKDILVDGTSLSQVDLDRVLTTDLSIDGSNLKINYINYFAAETINRNSKGLVEPIVKLDGNLDLAHNGAVKNLGFTIPKPLPSEFLNVLIGQKLFKKGTISGEMQVLNQSPAPILDGKIVMNKTFIPSQRLYIRNGSVTAKNDFINIDVQGRFKKSVYKFDGKINNSLAFPIIVKNTNLTIDELDVEKILSSFNQQNTTAVANEQQIIQDINSAPEDENDENYTFNTGLIIVENSTLNIIKGAYKNIKFGNANAKMTLDKDGILSLHSNRFDFAEGISSLRVKCDLKNHNYKIALGVREINSDLIASTLLNLPREISGKARGLIVLNTDDSLKLNGEMKFSIENGNIAKIGFVEYILNVASLFRNPLAMINPSTVFDLTNLPEGNFDNISGEIKLKDNIAEKIMIKSTAPQLSTFIIGRYDIENNDAALRIYTKFSAKTKDIKGILRNISLNKLANVVPLGSKNNNNYYEAELKLLPPIEADEKDCQVFLTTADGDLTNNNFISSLKKIK